MPTLDTNVLVRFLVRDDDAQQARAERLLRQAVESGQSLFVPVSVALELEWVLRSRYRLDKAAFSSVLAGLLSTAELSFDSEPALELALHLHRQPGADFADCVHTALAVQAGQGPLFTFDERAARLDGAAPVPAD